MASYVIFGELEPNRKRVRWKLYTVFPKKPDPETFYYNFGKIDLISIKIGTHNLYTM